MQRTPHTISLDDAHSLYLVEAGKGRPILLIHGAITTSHDWLSGIFDDVARLGRAIAVDRPGHGRSWRGRFESSPHAQARAIYAGLQRLGIGDPVSIVGHSFGGLVALAYAEIFPGAVEKLVLLAPIALPEFRPAEHSLYAPRATPFLGPLWSDALAGSVDRAALSLMHRLMFAPGPVPGHWQESYPWEWMASGAAGVSNGEDAAAIHPLTHEGMIDFARVAAPTHILHGRADLVVRPERQAMLALPLLRDARLDLLDGGGHMIHHSHASGVVEAVAAALRQGA